MNHRACLRCAVIPIAFASLSVFDAPAHADEPLTTELALETMGEPQRFRPGWLSAGAAIVPGAVLHGSGVWAAGDQTTALRLAAVEGVGLGMMAAGMVPLMLTEASGQNLDITAALLTAGAGLFLMSGLADIYGATLGEREARAPELEPYLEPFAGYAYVYDRQFRYRHFSVGRVDARLGRLRIAPEGWLAMNSDNQRVGLEVAARLIGPRPDQHAVDGSFVDAQIGGVYHRFGDDGFSILTPEFSFPMRLDLRRVGPSLRGSFVDLDLGWAFQFFDYGLPGRRLGTDISALLLLRFGYGLYFGGPTKPRGLVELYYDHRHDGFAGGLALDAHDPNLLGHVGVKGEANVGQGWGLRADFELGSAIVAMIGAVYAWDGGS